MSARALLKEAYIAAQRVTGGERRLRAHIQAGGHALVLNFHRVSPEINPFYQPLHPRLFDELVSYLRRYFWVTTFGELLGGERSSRPPVVLSFDDGFHDFVEYVEPILRKHGVRANQNVIVGSLETGERPWTQRLNDLLVGSPRGVAELSLPGFERRLSGDSAEEKARFGAALGAFLISRPREERATIVRRVDELAAASDARVTRMMSLDDARQLAGTHEIGAHSYGHDPMDVETQAFFQDDLARCADFFRDRIGRPMAVYAFPYGRCRPEQVDAALAHPDVRAVLLVGDRYAAPAGPVYPRINMGANDAAELRLQALGYRARS